MKTNMGDADRVIRTLLAVFVGFLYVTGVIGGWTAIILGAISAIFLLTSLVSFCPLYAPFKISTRSSE